MPGRLALTLTGLALAALAQAWALAWPGPDLPLLPMQGQPSAWLQMLALACACGLLMHTTRPVRAFWLGWFFGITWLTGTFWWLYVSMHVHGGLPALWAACGVLALATVLGLYYAVMWAVFIALRHGLARTGASQSRSVTWQGILRDALLFAACWTLAELMRAQWFTGFPWGAIGYAHVDGPLGAYAPWLGVYGVGALAATGSAMLAGLACAWLRTGLRSVPTASAPLLGGLLLCVPAAWQAVDEGALRWGRPGETLTLALLQGNIGQSEKFEPARGVRQALDWYARQADQAVRQAGVQLVVAPETAVPLFGRQLPPDYLSRLREPLKVGQAILLGMPLDEAGAYTNSVVGLRGAVAAPPGQYRYDKHHLVPFGEFVPPLFRWFTDLMRIPLGDFARGGGAQAPFVHAGQRIALNICYEDLFGEELARSHTGDEVPSLMANVSNIAWFGRTVAVDQHLQISRMRSLEFQRPMIRATNNGATAVIDARGRVVASLPPHQAGVLLGHVQGQVGEATPYARWAGHWGLWPLWVICLTVVVFCGVTNRTNFARMHVSERRIRNTVRGRKQP